MAHYMMIASIYFFFLVISATHKSVGEIAWKCMSNAPTRERERESMMVNVIKYNINNILLEFSEMRRCHGRKMCGI